MELVKIWGLEAIRFVSEHYGFQGILVAISIVSISFWGIRTFRRGRWLRHVGKVTRRQLWQAMHTRVDALRTYFTSTVLPAFKAEVNAHWTEEQRAQAYVETKEHYGEILSACENSFGTLLGTKVTAHVKIYDVEKAVFGEPVFASGVNGNRKSGSVSISADAGLFARIRSTGNAAYNNDYNKALGKKKNPTPLDWLKNQWARVGIEDQTTNQLVSFNFPRKEWRDFYQSGLVAPITIVAKGSGDKALIGALCLDAEIRNCWEHSHLELANFFADVLATVFSLHLSLVDHKILKVVK